MNTSIIGATYNVPLGLANNGDDPEKVLVAKRAAADLDPGATKAVAGANRETNMASFMVLRSLGSLSFLCVSVEVVKDFCVVGVGAVVRSSRSFRFWRDLATLQTTKPLLTRGKYVCHELIIFESQNSNSSSSTSTSSHSKTLPLITDYSTCHQRQLHHSKQNVGSTRRARDGSRSTRCHI